MVQVGVRIQLVLLSRLNKAVNDSAGAGSLWGIAEKPYASGKHRVGPTPHKKTPANFLMGGSSRSRKVPFVRQEFIESAFGKSADVLENIA